MDKYLLFIIIIIIISITVFIIFFNNNYEKFYNSCDGTNIDDCLGHWGDCDGTRQKYFIDKPKKNNGKDCIDSNGKILDDNTYQSCNNCQGSWSVCNKKTGMKNYTINIPKNGCNSSDCMDELGNILDNNSSTNCPVDCEGYFKSCNSDNKQFYKINIPPKNGGKNCVDDTGKILDENSFKTCNYNDSDVPQPNYGYQYSVPLSLIPSPTPSPTPTPTQSPSPTPSPTQSPTPTPIQSPLFPDPSSSNPFDCVGNWKYCDTITGTQTFYISKEAINGGKECTNKTGDIRNCDIDCTGYWSKCIDYPNVGKKLKYIIKTQKKNNGKDCINEYSSDNAIVREGDYANCINN